MQLGPSEEFFRLLPCDTQEIEGANSIIKRVHSLAPNIKLPLMSARILIKKALGGQILHSGRQARLDAINYAVETHQQALQQFQLISVPGDVGRFPTIQRTDLPEPLPLMDGCADSACDSQRNMAASPDGENVDDSDDDLSSASGADGNRGKKVKTVSKTKAERKPRTPNEGHPEKCVSRLVALLQASAPRNALQSSATRCLTFELILV